MRAAIAEFSRIPRLDCVAAASPRRIRKLHLHSIRSVYGIPCAGRSSGAKVIFFQIALWLKSFVDTTETHRSNKVETLLTPLLAE